MSDASPKLPADPGDAVQQLLETADAMTAGVRSALATWREGYPLPTLLNEWNAEARRYDTERQQVANLRRLEYEIGTSYDPEVHHQRIRDIFQRTGCALPAEPDWNEIRPIARWRELQSTATACMERLRGLRLAALPIVGDFPNRSDTEIQGHLDWLLVECNNLSRFCPLDFSRIGERTAVALETGLEDQARHLDLLVGRIRPAGDPLRDLVAMYRGKHPPLTPRADTGFIDRHRSAGRNRNSARSRPVARDRQT